MCSISEWLFVFVKSFWSKSHSVLIPRAFNLQVAIQKMKGVQVHNHSMFTVGKKYLLLF